MARKKRTTSQKEVQDYRHDAATQKNNKHLEGIKEWKTRKAASEALSHEK